MTLRRVIESIRRNKAPSLNEKDTESKLIVPILKALGWNVNDPKEFRKPFNTGVGRVDFGLFATCERYVLLEAKKSHKDLCDHEWELLLYSFEYGAPLSILCNGFEWWFYMPMAECRWKKRKFLRVDLKTDEVSEIERNLYQYASKAQVANGKALEQAGTALASKIRARREELTVGSAQTSGAASATSTTPQRASGEFKPMGPTRAQTKTQLVEDVLRYEWRNEKYLTWLTGQEGGWPKWVYDTNAKKSDTLCLLTKVVPGSRSQLMRLATPVKEKRLCKQPGVQIYEPNRRIPLESEIDVLPPSAVKKKTEKKSRTDRDNEYLRFWRALVAKMPKESLFAECRPRAYYHMKVCNLFGPRIYLNYTINTSQLRAELWINTGDVSRDSRIKDALWRHRGMIHDEIEGSLDWDTYAKSYAIVKYPCAFGDFRNKEHWDQLIRQAILGMQGLYRALASLSSEVRPYL